MQREKGFHKGTSIRWLWATCTICQIQRPRSKLTINIPIRGCCGEVRWTSAARQDDRNDLFHGKIIESCHDHSEDGVRDAPHALTSNPQLRKSDGFAPLRGN